MKPTARHDIQHTDRASDAHQVNVDGVTHLLEPAMYRILLACDGARSVAQIATSLELSVEATWRALDRLSDMNLLTDRVSPAQTVIPTALPAGITRREALAQLALGVAGGAAAALVMRPGNARAEEGVKIESGGGAKAAATSTASADAETASEAKMSDAQVEAEIEEVSKRISERKAKRREALQCKRLGRKNQEAAKKKQCADPIALKTEIDKDTMRLARRRRHERHRKSRATHSEASTKKKSN